MPWATPTSEDSVGRNPTDTQAPPDDGQLLAQLRQWRAVVELFAARHDAEVDEQAYRTLHRELLACCRTEAASAGPRRDLLGALESLVEPWVSPEAFVAADRDALASLLAHCRQIEASAFGVQPASNRWGWVTLLVVALLATAAGVYAHDRVDWFPSRIPSVASLQRTVTDHPAVTLAVTVVAAIFASLRFVSRPTRR